MKPGLSSSVAFFLVALVVLFSIPFCTNSTKTTEEPTFINHSDTVHYVGMDACASCHFDKKETFIHTGMGQSFALASREKSIGEFGKEHLIYDEFSDFYYWPFWKNDTLYVKEFRLNADDTLYSRDQAINYVVGSGQHTNSHLFRQGEYIVQAPFTWYAQKNKLDLPPGFENGNNSRFTRVIDEECMGCHNSMPEMISSGRAFKTVGSGIDCERCHGPGSAHVAYRSTGMFDADAEDWTIVNPSKLTLERQIDVCQRCHLQGNNVLKPGKKFSDFRPGMILSDVFEIYLPKYDDESVQFNMANHSDRLQASKCFIESNKSGQTNLSLTCITCHNPHISVKQTGKAHFISNCVGCHSSGTQKKCVETVEVRRNYNDNCIVCHMPKSGTEDIPHVTVHDHKIGIGQTDVNAKGAKEVIGLYAVNNKNPKPHMLVQAYLTYFEKFDPLPIYQTLAAQLLQQHPNVSQEIHLNFQLQNWTAIVELAESLENGSFDVNTIYRIGKAYYLNNQFSDAKEWLELAVVKDDQRFEYKSELAATFIKLKDYKAAVNMSNRCISQFSTYVPAHNNRGFAHLMLGELSMAKRSFLHVLSLDPDNRIAMENLVLLYTQQNNSRESEFWKRNISSLR